MKEEERRLDAKVHLMDRQIRDCNDRTAGVIADIEISDVPWGQRLDPDADPPTISNLLMGPIAATRIFGGRPPESRWHRIPWKDVDDIGVAVELGVDGEELSVMWVERWMRKHVIARIPGGRRDPR